MAGAGDHFLGETDVTFQTRPQGIVEVLSNGRFGRLNMRSTAGFSPPIFTAPESTSTKCRIPQRTMTRLAENCDRLNSYISMRLTAADFGK
jgi:hypothetical protein